MITWILILLGGGYLVGVLVALFCFWLVYFALRIEVHQYGTQQPTIKDDLYCVLWAIPVTALFAPSTYTIGFFKKLFLKSSY